MTAGPSPITRLTSTGSAYAGAVALQVLVQAAALPVLTRLLDPDEYGLTATALVVGNLLAVVVDLGLARAVTRAYYRGPDGPADAAAVVVGALAAVAVLSGVAFLLLPAWDGWLARDALEVAMVLGGAMAARNVVLGLLRAAERARAYVAVMLLGTAGAQVAGLAVAAVVPTPVGYLSGLVAGSLVGAALGLGVLRPSVARLRSADVWRWALRFGLPLVPGELAAVAIWFSDRIVIERLLGLEEVGRYQIAYTLGSVILMLAMGVSQAWAPIVYGADAGDRARVADETHAVLARLASYGVVAVSLAAPVVLVLLIPAEYRPDGLFWVASLVALSVLPLLTQQAASHLLSDAGRTGRLGAYGVAAAALNVVLNLLLVPTWELTGSAVATLLTYGVYALLVVRAAGWRPALQWGPWALAAGGAGVGSALPAGGAWSVVRSLLALAVAAVCLREVVALRRVRS